MEVGSTSIAARQAQALLQAWVCGDLPRLHAELDRSTFLSTGAESVPGSEQLELLKSVASQMRSCRDLYAERSTDTRLGVCVDLLMHLSSSLSYRD